MFATLLFAMSLTSDRQATVNATFDPATGIYQITDRATGWSFLGQAPGQASDVGSSSGHDGIGAYDEITFVIGAPAAPAHASIRSYSNVRAVKFRLEYRKARPDNGMTFPDFSAFPAHLHEFSYRDSTFAPPMQGLAQTATPWLLFDDIGRSVIISPASEFMVSRMVGDGKTEIGEGFDSRLQHVSPGLAQETVLTFGDHIGSTWHAWGETMRRLYDRPIPKVDSDPLVKLFGYWTDNGADYYYNYEPDKGYAGTLLDVRERYRSEGIPLGYMQLDSWWYSKTIDDPDGKPGGTTKNAKLPEGAWNRYGGLYEYRASPDLFPNGLSAFDKQIRLPLAVHDRWMDRNSPYHRAYRISGIAVTDPKWWRETADYLASSGVTCYEQDWLDPIYANSPEMASEPGVGDAFTDGMAHAMQRHGMSVQYCMATPRFFLQGLRYPNLTTIRTSGDRFEPRKWANFLYGSQYAQAVGIWPWCDVFKSAETGNMILATLSGGPVGTGDALGKESKDAILKAARPDGVIVKPDEALTPCAQTYLGEANHRNAPFWASTFTEHEGLKTTYLFGFMPAATGEPATWSVDLADAGVKGDVYLYDALAGTGRRLRASSAVEVTPGSRTEGRAPFDFAYLVAAPFTFSGVALLGDLGKWASMGKQRIDAVEDRRDGLHVRVLFAPQERSVTLEGVSANRPNVRALGGARIALKGYELATQRWTLEVVPAANQHTAQFVVNGR